MSSPKSLLQPIFCDSASGHKMPATQYVKLLPALAAKEFQPSHRAGTGPATCNIKEKVETSLFLIKLILFQSCTGSFTRQQVISDTAIEAAFAVAVFRFHKQQRLCVKSCIHTHPSYLPI